MQKAITTSIIKILSPDNVEIIRSQGRIKYLNINYSFEDVPEEYVKKIELSWPFSNLRVRSDGSVIIGYLVKYDELDDFKANLVHHGLLKRDANGYVRFDRLETVRKVRVVG